MEFIIPPRQGWLYSMFMDHLESIDTPSADIDRQIINLDVAHKLSDKTTDTEKFWRLYERLLSSQHIYKPEEVEMHLLTLLNVIETGLDAHKEDDVWDKLTYAKRMKLLDKIISNCETQLKYIQQIEAPSSAPLSRINECRKHLTYGIQTLDIKQESLSKLNELENNLKCLHLPRPKIPRAATSTLEALHTNLCAFRGFQRHLYDKNSPINKSLAISQGFHKQVTLIRNIVVWFEFCFASPNKSCVASLASIYLGYEVEKEQVTDALKYWNGRMSATDIILGGEAFQHFTS
ncbi:hypothetical protein [Photobacterium chitinilyticum]|uniref:Uncharacterized protein n=1 Tax=Photobacterium chitinilyticum TaxID=2485123 RepID=A0A444JL20_9GAMM|nr:hypothetical protein [Photobacterium chitinilyticum]RWX53796.1 hypothetical protein EDI28_20300 [Photobacterium chitinilyticum]